jgi:hypothetical protein
MRYGGSNPPLCTIFSVVLQLVVSCAGEPVDLSPAGSGRMVIALVVLGLLAVLSWQTMEPGKFRSLTWVLLGFFAFRVLLGRLRSR